MAFDLDRFIADCREARAADPTHKSVREVVTRAVGEPSRGGIAKLYHDPDLTILNVVWPAAFTIVPHNHHMWAVIGIYTGREDNIFWRRCPAGERRCIEAAGAKALSVGDAEPLGRDVIHSVNNPIPRLSGAIHVYGGDFFAAQRSEWDAETLVEGRYDFERNVRMMAAANAKALA